MSEKLLEILQKKNPPTKKKDIEIILPGQIALSSVKITRSKEKHDFSSFRNKLKLQKKPSIINISKPVLESTKLPPKKIKKIKKLGKFRLKIIDKNLNKLVSIEPKKKRRIKTSIKR